MGVRQIIGHFFADAVDIARDLFNMDRLVVHIEIEVPEVEIPRIGKIHGPLDYLTFPVNEQDLTCIRCPHVPFRWIGCQGYGPIFYLCREKKTSCSR
jgi:hypothetical protein